MRVRLQPFLLWTLATVSACGDSTPSIDAGPPPPAIHVTDLSSVQGALTARAEERGVLLNLWASW